MNKTKDNSKKTKEVNKKTTKEKDNIKLLEKGKKVKLYFVGKTDFFTDKETLLDNALKKTRFIFVDENKKIFAFTLGNMHIAFSELEAYKAYNVQFDELSRQYRFVPTKGHKDALVDEVLKENDYIRENNFIIKQIKYEKILNVFIYIEILAFLALLYVTFFVEWSIGLVSIIGEIVIYYIVYEIMYLNYKKYYKFFTKGS